MGRVIVGSDCYECRSVVVSDGVIVLDFGLSLHLGSEIIIQVLGEGLSCTSVRSTGRVYVSGCVYDVWCKTVICVRDRNFWVLEGLRRGTM